MERILADIADDVLICRHTKLAVRFTQGTNGQAISRGLAHSQQHRAVGWHCTDLSPELAV